jgi:hypothetical protein
VQVPRVNSEKVSKVPRYFADRPRVSRFGGATGSPNGSRLLLTSAQFSEVRRKRADLDAKLRQMTSAERERRR